jgi:hypothetical protein
MVNGAGLLFNHIDQLPCKDIGKAVSQYIANLPHEPYRPVILKRYRKRQ